MGNRNLIRCGNTVFAKIKPVVLRRYLICWSLFNEKQQSVIQPCTVIYECKKSYQIFANTVLLEVNIGCFFYNTSV